MSNTTAGTNSCALTGPARIEVTRTATAAASDVGKVIAALLDCLDRASTAPDPISPATGALMIYDLRDGDRSEDLHGEPAGFLRGRAPLLQFRARALRGRSRLRGARPVGASGSGEDRRGTADAVRAREARRLARAQPRDRRDEPGGDRPCRRHGGGTRRDRRRQRHRRRDRLRLRARQADRRLSRRLPAERRQRRLHGQLAGRVFHPRERRCYRESLRGPGRVSAPAARQATSLIHSRASAGGAPAPRRPAARTAIGGNVMIGTTAGRSRRAWLALLVLAVALGCAAPQVAPPAPATPAPVAQQTPAPGAPANDLLNAVLWMQRSVEYKANAL